jgi:hypothetical protein
LILLLALLEAGCNLVGPSGPTSGDLYAFNTSAQTAFVRTTETAAGDGQTVTVWEIPASGDGFVASLGNAKVEVLDFDTCAVVATLDPIRGRVTALIKDDGKASFEGLPAADSSSPPPPAFQPTTNCGEPASS